MLPGHCYLVEHDDSLFISKVVSLESHTYHLEYVEIEPSLRINRNFFHAGDIHKIREVSLDIYNKCLKLIRDSISKIKSLCVFGPIEPGQLRIGYCYSYCYLGYTAIVHITEVDEQYFRGDTIAISNSSLNIISSTWSQRYYSDREYRRVDSMCFDKLKKMIQFTMGTINGLVKSTI